MVLSVNTAVVLLALVVAAAHATTPSNTRGRKVGFRLQRDDWFDAQFTGQPKYACAKTGYPRGDRFEGYHTRFLLQTPEAARRLFCVLRGSDEDLQGMTRSLGLSTRFLKRGPSSLITEVTAPEVRCVSRPRLLASLFDLVVVSGRHPRHEAWCLLARAPPPPHGSYEPRFPLPTGGALVIRFRDRSVPDVVCSPDIRREDENEQGGEDDDGAEFFVQGLQERWNTYFRCNFQRTDNTSGPSAHTLLLSLVLELGLGSGMYRGRPVTWLPAQTCREACPDRAPRTDDLVRLTGAYKDDYGLDIAITSPSGRTATCDVPEKSVFHDGGSAFQMRVILQNRTRLVCHNHRVPLGEDVDGTNFYFIVRSDQAFQGSKVFRCKLKNGEQYGGDTEVESLLLGVAQQVGLRVSREDVELGHMVPSVHIGASACGFVRPPGYLYHFDVQVESAYGPHYCAFDLESAQRRQDNQDDVAPWRNDDSSVAQMGTDDGRKVY